jgi:hypothetical protein
LFVTHHDAFVNIDIFKRFTALSVMKFIKQISKILLLTAGLLCLVQTLAAAQSKKKGSKFITKAAPQRVAVSRQLSSFLKEAREAGVDFTMPANFKELQAVNNENFSFDYAMTIPGQDFEVWLQVHSLKQNWMSYDQVKDITSKTLDNPDSTYLQTARAHATAMSDDDKYFTRPLPANVLEMYNADAGKTYLFNLANIPETRRYKYALLIAIQKNHTGYLMAVCLANEKGPAFFKNINQARDCIKFR